MNTLIQKTVPDVPSLPQWLDYAQRNIQQHKIAPPARHIQVVRSGILDAVELSRVAEWAALYQAALQMHEREKHRKKSKIQTPPLVPASHYKLASAEIRHLSSLVKQLAALRECEETDDYGVLRANERSYNEARQLLIDATIMAAMEGREIPDGCVSTDSEGGVRIEWVRQQSSVRLVIPVAPARQPYLYHEVGNAYATEHPTAEALAHWLGVID